MSDRSLETVHIPDGPDGTQTKHVADGPLDAATRDLRGSETQFVPDGAVKPDASATQFVPDLPRFGRFQALAELGAGGMGSVYRAHDDVLGRAVAIKALHPQSDADLRQRFLREAKAIGAVLHPNILAIYDAGTEKSTPYLVMELASGGSLRDRIAAGRMPVDAVREIGIQIARGLAAAHNAKILHRDVKPANILCAGDTWKLADFGIARLPDSTLTVTGQFLGSPSYAAPESLRAGEFSPASDIYGLGATLYEALVGSPPHGDHDMRSLVRKLEEDPPPIHTRRAMPGPLGDAIMAALDREPSRRPTADALARMLALTGDVPRAVPASRNRKLAFIAIGAAAIGIAMLVAAIKSRSAASTPLLPTQPQPAVAKPAEPDRAAPPRAADPAQPAEPAQPADPAPPAAPFDPSQPVIVDEHGNVTYSNGDPVDQETAQKILEQMERDARKEYEQLGRGRGRWKHRRDD